MRSVKSLIAELQKFPPDAVCWVYEGEACGVVVVPSRESRDSIGYVSCSAATGPLEDGIPAEMSMVKA
jgi:hypothetical protein